MRLNYNLAIVSSFIVLSSASHCYASPELAGRENLSQLLANLPSEKASEEVERDIDDQNTPVMRKYHSARKAEQTKPESESLGDESNAGKSRHGYDGFRTNRLNLAPLNLSTEQKDKIQALRKESAQKSRKIRACLEAKRAEMRDLMFDPKATNRQILKVRDEARKLHEQADDLMVQDFLAIRQLLTAEQKIHLPEIKPVPKGQIK